MFHYPDIDDAIITKAAQIEEELKEVFHRIDEISGQISIKYCLLSSNTKSVKQILIPDPATDIMKSAGKSWKAFMPISSILRMLWFDHRSPVEHMHFFLRLAPFFFRVMKSSFCPVRLMTVWKNQLALQTVLAL